MLRFDTHTDLNCLAFGILSLFVDGINVFLIITGHVLSKLKIWLKVIIIVQLKLRPVNVPCV
jgi:hypothetical protein